MNNRLDLKESCFADELCFAGLDVSDVSACVGVSPPGVYHDLAHPYMKHMCNPFGLI